MIPKPMKVHKRFDDKAELKEGDAVYFRIFESNYSSKWIVRKVVVKSKDGVVRKCIIQYQNLSEDQPRYADRAARSLIRHFNMDDIGLRYRLKAVGGHDHPVRELGVQHRVGAKMSKMKMVKNCKNCCCANHCLLTGHERNDVCCDHLEAAMEDKFPNMLDKSWNKFEYYEQDVLNTLPLVEDKLMLLFCAVNTDFTGVETEPDASVDSSFSPELYGKGHSLGRSRRYYQVRLQSRLYSALNFLL